MFDFDCAGRMFYELYLLANSVSESRKKITCTIVFMSRRYSLRFLFSNNGTSGSPPKRFSQPQELQQGFGGNFEELVSFLLSGKNMENGGTFWSPLLTCFQRCCRHYWCVWRGILLHNIWCNCSRTYLVNTKTTSSSFIGNSASK